MRLRLLRHPVTLVKRLVWRDRIEMSTTSGFFRNAPQLRLLTRLMATPRRAYVFGCSLGCEAYSLRIAYAMWQQHTTFELVGFDIDDDVLSVARRGEYTTAQLDYYANGEVSRGPASRFFTPEPNRAVWRVSDEIAHDCRFEHGSVLDDAFMSALPQADLVLCQNVLIHMTEAQNRQALSNLRRVVSTDGLLAIGGMQPETRAKLARELSLSAVTDDVREIHDGWRDLRRMWDEAPAFLRPYYALEPFRAGLDSAQRYSTIFRVT